MRLQGIGALRQLYVFPYDTIQCSGNVVEKVVNSGDTEKNSILRCVLYYYRAYAPGLMFLVIQQER